MQQWETYLAVALCLAVLLLNFGIVFFLMRQWRMMLVLLKFIPLITEEHEESQDFHGSGSCDDISTKTTWKY